MGNVCSFSFNICVPTEVLSQCRPVTLTLLAGPWLILFPEVWCLVRVEGSGTEVLRSLVAWGGSFALRVALSKSASSGGIDAAPEGR